MKKLLIIIPIFLIFFSCNTINTKIDKVSQKEEDKLSKLLNKDESEVKIVFGIPDLIESKDKNKILIYYDTKFKVKCERRFEINQMKKVVGFSSKNCF